MRPSGGAHEGMESEGLGRCGVQMRDLKNSIVFELGREMKKLPGFSCGWTC